MYQLCVLLLKFVRRYCVRRCGDSWYNLWRDMIGDARCFPKPSSPPEVEPPVVTTEKLLDVSLRIASTAGLLHTVVATDKPNLFDIEDACGHLCDHIEWFQDLLNQLPVERPTLRRFTSLSDLYNKYEETK